jgi:hypothetical protein
MRQRKIQRPILPPHPPRRKERDEQAQRDWFPPIPSRVEDLRGMKFGMLRVRAFAGMGKEGSYWCCECDCGSLCRVPRRRLLGHSRGKGRAPGIQVSCGCRRADPAVRKAARRKVDPARRAEICDAARAARKHGSRPYSMLVDQAARELRCELSDVEKMAQDGDLRSIVRADGKLYLSAEDVRRWAKVQRRNSRHCRVLEDVQFGKS